MTFLDVVAEWRDGQAEYAAWGRVLGGSGDNDEEVEGESEPKTESDEESDSEVETEDDDDDDEDDDEDSETNAATNQSRGFEDLLSPIPFRPLPIPAILRAIAPVSQPTPPPPQPQPMYPPWSSFLVEERQAIYVPDLVPDCRAPAAVRRRPVLWPPSPPPRKMFRPCFGASCPVGCTLDRHEAIERAQERQREKEEEEMRRREMRWRVRAELGVVCGPDRSAGDSQLAVHGNRGKLVSGEGGG